MARAREGRRGRVLTATVEVEAREYWYDGTETGGRMILCGDKTEISEGVVGGGGGCPPMEGHQATRGEGGAG